MTPRYHSIFLLLFFLVTDQRWYMFQNMGPAPSGRSGHAMASVGAKVFVLGGESFTPPKQDNPNWVHVLDTSAFSSWHYQSMRYNFLMNRTYQISRHQGSIAATKPSRSTRCTSTFPTTPLWTSLWLRRTRKKALFLCKHLRLATAESITARSGSDLPV